MHSLANLGILITSTSHLTANNLFYT